MKLKTAHRLPSSLVAVEAMPLTGQTDIELAGCYVSDLLSDVLANAQPGVLWVTIHTHRNILSVAAMKDIAAILFTCGREPAAAIIAEAVEQGIWLLSTPLNTYETAGRLWKAGLR